jgi:hypothetical protein
MVDINNVPLNYPSFVATVNNIQYTTNANGQFSFVPSQNTSYVAVTFNNAIVNLLASLNSSILNQTIVASNVSQINVTGCSGIAMIIVATV